MQETKSWSLDWGGRTLTVETGRLALIADASCTVRYGDTVVLATVVKSKNVRDGIDYFPLMVDFEEKFYAAGKIKGSRFIKREGRPSDEGILTARLIDRALRPLFDERIRNDIQVVLTPLSIDSENDSAICSMVAASIVLSISPIAWDGPIACARVGRVNGELILNATCSQIEEGDLDLIVAGTSDKLVMTEAGAKEVSDDEMLEAIKWGCSQLTPVIDFISQIQSEVGLPKEEVPVAADDDRESDDMDEQQVRDLVKQYVSSHADDMIFDTNKIGRKERVKMVEDLAIGAQDMLAERDDVDPSIYNVGLNKIKDYICTEITKRILEQEQRLDGRALNEVRELKIDIDLIPRVHGSGMFMRGDTQVLSVVTLGAPGDVQTLDTMEEEGTKRYMHHYNDAPYTYGDVRPMRGPSRRAIGHGALAERALDPVLPAEEEFPYAIRVVSEVMGSNGSSSMASTCASTLALMAAGVPIKKPVAGIAMGLASDESGNWKVLTDLQDVEDGKGGMDFKIAGTADGITGVQMDTKTKGLSWEIVDQTFVQSKEARLHILSKMQEVVAQPKSELSPYAPRIVTIQIDPEKIRDVIGPGGKVINKIIDETGVKIDIEDDGRVMITSSDDEGMKQAVKTVEEITHEVEAGEIYDGEVVRLEDFGAFVKITPNQDGLVHVSEIAWEHVKKPGDILNLGDKVKVKVKEIDNLGRINLTMKELKPKPEGLPERPAGDRRSGGRGQKPQRKGGFFKKQS